MIEQYELLLLCTRSEEDEASEGGIMSLGISESESSLSDPGLGRTCQRDYKPVFGLFPARIREISSPRLNAWLNISRV